MSKSTIKIEITGKFSDCYIYYGCIFFIGVDGRIAYMPYDNFIDIFKERNSKLAPLFDLFFLRNEYMAMSSAKTILSVASVREQLIKEWNQMSEAGGLTINFADIERCLTYVDAESLMPVLDMKIYNMKMLFGNTKGLHEFSLIPTNKSLNVRHNAEKRFDGRVVNISAGYGSIALSAAGDGLISGFWDYERDNFQINEHRNVVNGRSMRTSWSGCDLINYDTQRSFQFLQNSVDVEKKPIPQHNYWNESKERKVIKEYASSLFDRETIFSKSKINADDIAYCFNSNENAFFFMRDGKFIRQGFVREENIIRLSVKEIALIGPNKKRYFSKPLSSVMTPVGCAVEFYDNVLLFMNNKAYQIEDREIMSMRSFMTSSRYRYILAISKEDGISLHSLYPFDTIANFEPRKRNVNNRQNAHVDTLVDSPQVEPPFRIVGNENEFDLPF